MKFAILCLVLVLPGCGSLYTRLYTQAEMDAAVARARKGPVITQELFDSAVDRAHYNGYQQCVDTVEKETGKK